MSEDIISHEFAGLDATDVSCYGVRSHNVGREGATPIQRGPNASLFGRAQAVKFIRHNALRDLMTN